MVAKLFASLMTRLGKLQSREPCGEFVGCWILLADEEPLRADGVANLK